MHGVLTAHDGPSMSVSVQVDAPPLGSVEVAAWPVLETATHSVVDGQAMPT